MKNLVLKSRKLSLLALFLVAFGLMSFTSSNETSEKFWGSSTSCGPSYSIEPGSCYHNCTTTYQVFWVVVSSKSDIAVPC